MTVLLDTVAFVLLISDDEKLTPAARFAISDPDNDLIISVASLWELAIKTNTGKFHFDQPVQVLIPELLRQYGIAPLSIDADDALAVSTLPHVHRDPFDRLIVAQATRRALPVMTPDGLFSEYGVTIIW